MHTATNVRPSDPATSHIAAAGSPGRDDVRRIVGEVLEAHREGLTDWELFTLTGLPERLRGSVVRRRLDFHPVDTGVRRLSPSGRPMIVWALATAVGQ